MYVLIPLILSIFCSFANPYVGLFGLFAVVELIILFCVDINANVRIRLCPDISKGNTAKSNRLQKSAKTLATTECILAFVFTIIITIVEIGVWLLANGNLTGNATIMAPFPLVSEDNLSASQILLALGIAFQFITLILSYIRRRQLVRRTNRVFS